VVEVKGRNSLLCAGGEKGIGPYSGVFKKVRALDGGRRAGDPGKGTGNRNVQGGLAADVAEGQFIQKALNHSLAKRYLRDFF